MATQSKVNRDNYIVIQGWMLTDLKLKGNELIIYACIYGFSQAENQAFSGSLQYLADWTNSTKQGVIKALKSLVEKGYITKEDYFVNNVKFVKYYSTKFTGVLNKVEQGVKQSLPGGVKQSLPNNIVLDNIVDNKDNNNIVNLPKKKQFKAPTVEEVAQYCAERKNNVDPKKFVDYYEAAEWIDAKGKKVRNWKQKVITWERNDNNSGKTYGATGIEIKKPAVDDLAGIF